jgi:hypothetical protein
MSPTPEYSHRPLQGGVASVYRIARSMECCFFSQQSSSWHPLSVDLVEYGAWHGIMTRRRASEGCGGEAFSSGCSSSPLWLSWRSCMLWYAAGCGTAVRRLLDKLFLFAFVVQLHAVAGRQREAYQEMCSGAAVALA